jgi:hypothetical protein
MKISVKTFILLSAVAFSAPPAFADPIFRVNHGTNQQIDKFGVCKNITNSNASKDVMVPTNTNGEWSAFLANPPSNVTVPDCSPTFECLSSGTSGGANSIATPSCLAAGDLIILFMYTSAGDDFTGTTWPTGYQVLDNTYPVNGSYHSQKRYKIADATDVAAGSITVTKATGWSPGDDNGLMAFVIRYVNQTTPIQTNTLNRLINSGSITYTGTTTTQNNSMIALIGETGVAPPAPSGYTANWSNATLGSSFSSKILPVAGATGSPTASFGAGLYTCVGDLIVINPR